MRLLLVVVVILENLYDIGEHEGAYKYERSTEPVPRSERIIKVDDRYDKTGEFAQREH